MDGVVLCQVQGSGFYLDLISESSWCVFSSLSFLLDGSSATLHYQALHQFDVLCELSDCVFCSMVQMVEDVHVGADNIPQESSSTCNWP